MDLRVRNAIAKIEVAENGSGRVHRGTATLVRENLVLTALHVIADRDAAARLTPQMGNHPLPVHPGEISVTFWNGLTSTARVVEGKWDAREDWALLECTTALPNTIRPLPLARIDRDGDTWETYGFPDAKPDGLAVGGSVRDWQGNVLGEFAHQLYCVEAAAGDGMPVNGLSGAPVVIGGMVVGILRWALLTEKIDVAHRRRKTNVGGAIYACPSERFAAHCGYTQSLTTVSALELPAAIPVVPGSGKRARPAVIGAWLLIAASVVGISMALWALRPRSDTGDPVPPPPPAPTAANGAPSFQIIVDRSDAMMEPFGGGTKLEAAKSALVNVLLEKTSDRDNLALREFGGECSDLDSTRLVLPFAPGEKRLAQEVGRFTTTHGKSTLVNAVIEATGDFNDERFRRTTAGLIVIAGGYEPCGHDDPAAAIRQRLASYPGLTLDLRFIGVALTTRAQAVVGKVAEDTRGTFKNVRTPAELGEAVEHALVVEAKVNEVQTAVVILNGSMTHLNTAVVKHLGSAPNYPAANQEVGEAERALKRTVVPTPEPHHPQEVRELLDMAREARAEQQKMLDATRALIAAKQAIDGAAEARARDAYNQSAIAYNARTEAINRQQNELLSK